MILSSLLFGGLGRGPALPSLIWNRRHAVNEGAAQHQNELGALGI